MTFGKIIFRGTWIKTVFPVAIFIIIFALLSIKNDEKRIHQEEITRLNQYAENLGKLVTTTLNDALRKNDFEAIQNALIQTGTFPLVKHAHLLSAEGRVYLSTKRETIGQILLKEEIKNISGEQTYQMLNDKGNAEEKCLRRIDSLPNKTECQLCHDPAKKILGFVNVDLTLEEMTKNLLLTRKRSVQRNILLAAVILGTIGLIPIFTTVFPIQRLINLSQKITYEGDLTIELPTKGKDEIAYLYSSFQQIVTYLREKANLAENIADGNLALDVRPLSEKDVFARNFEKMISNLRSLLEMTQQAAARVTEASKQFTSVTEQSTQTMSQLSGFTSQVSKSASSVSQSANTSLLSAQESLKSAQAGKETLGEVVAKMNTIRQTADATAEVINELLQHTQRIGEITKTITQIADQINLLSLNAAIEAARAGEAGRGFAVVADEVRKLAANSANAAGKINKIISGISEKTTKTVEMTEKTIKEIKEGVITTSGAEKKFYEIFRAAENISSQVENIASAAEETASLTEQSSAITQEQVAAIQELSASAQNLLQTAEELKNMVSRFKLA